MSRSKTALPAPAKEEVEKTEESPPATPLSSSKIRRPGDVVGSREARRAAAIVLEVLAGLRTPTEAGIALEISATHYYNIEARGLQGLVAALEPKPPGKRPDLSLKIAELEGEKKVLAAELARTHGLLRMARNAIGIRSPEREDSEGRTKKPRGKRKASVRARRAVKGLLGGDAATTDDLKESKAPKDAR